MIKDNKLYFKKELTDSFEFSEIDFDLQDDIGFYWEHHDDYVMMEKGRVNAEGHPIQIDRLIKKLQEMKTKGANYASLEYHCDHIGYLIDGWKVEKASEKDVEEYFKKEKEKRKEAIEKKRERLKRELDRLE